MTSVIEFKPLETVITDSSRACCGSNCCCDEGTSSNKGSVTSAVEIKQLVQEKYGEIALQSSQGCGCGSDCCSSDSSFSMIGDEYTTLAGYVPEADLGLGCGLPTESAQLQVGETVLDLGSGAGNDVFVARRIVGESGYVLGVDMTPAMVEKARVNATKVGYTNVEFRLGDIEALPVDSNIIDIAISNCVLNLVPNKAAAFSEMYRVLKPGGRFCISDIVVTRELPETIQQAATMYVGCVAGALLQNDYLAIITAAGFTDITITKEKLIHIPQAILSEYLSDEEAADFGQPVVSITVVGKKN